MHTELGPRPIYSTLKGPAGFICHERIFYVCTGFLTGLLLLQHISLAVLHYQVIRVDLVYAEFYLILLCIVQYVLLV